MPKPIVTLFEMYGSGAEQVGPPVAEIEGTTGSIFGTLPDGPGGSGGPRA